MGTESRSEYGHSPLSLFDWSGLLRNFFLECLLFISLDDLLGLFLPEDFFKVLVFVGVVIGDDINGDKIDPLVKCDVSGRVGEVDGGNVGWALFILSAVELSCKASFMDEEIEEVILSRSGRTDSASATLDFQEF